MGDHILDKAIITAQSFAPGIGETILSKRLGYLTVVAGKACRYDQLTSLSFLCTTAVEAMEWADDGAISDNILFAVREAYDEADRRYDGMTPYNPAMSDADRAAILIKGVGDVARTLIPDPDTPIGHGRCDWEDLVQVATTALAWAARLIDDKEFGNGR